MRGDIISLNSQRRHFTVRVDTVVVFYTRTIIFCSVQISSLSILTSTKSNSRMKYIIFSKKSNTAIAERKEKVPKIKIKHHTAF